MDDRLRQMAIIAKAIDHGSFRSAAQELWLSPSVISHHISQLEESLGIALIYRSTQKLTLTPEGHRRLAATHKMLEAVKGELANLSVSATARAVSPMTSSAQAQIDRPERIVIGAQDAAFRQLACLGVPSAQPNRGGMHVTGSFIATGDGFMAEAHGIRVLSSNDTLYGDISRRVSDLPVVR